MSGGLAHHEEVLQEWSYRGMNIPWMVLAIGMVGLFVLAALRDPASSLIDKVASVYLAFLFIVGVADEIRTSAPFRYACVVVLVIFGLYLLISSSSFTTILLGGYVLVSAVFVVARRFVY